MSTEICPECNSTIRPGCRGSCVSCVSCLRREIAGLRAANTDLRVKGARFAGADCCEKAELLDEIERLRAALIDQAKLWELAGPVFQEAGRDTFGVSFLDLHRPAEKAREAAKAAGGDDGQ
jgi:hypothetical protein